MLHETIVLATQRQVARKIAPLCYILFPNKKIALQAA